RDRSRRIRMPLVRHQFQSELLLKHGKDRWAGWNIRSGKGRRIPLREFARCSLVVREYHTETEQGRDPGFVHDMAVDNCRKPSGYFAQWLSGGVDRPIRPVPANVSNTQRLLT